MIFCGVGLNEQKLCIEVWYIYMYLERQLHDRCTPPKFAFLMLLVIGSVASSTQGCGFYTMMWMWM